METVTTRSNKDELISGALEFLDTQQHEITKLQQQLRVSLWLLAVVSTFGLLF